MQPKEMGLPTTAYYPKEQIREVTGFAQFPVNCLCLYASNGRSSCLYLANVLDSLPC